MAGMMIWRSGERSRGGGSGDERCGTADVAFFQAEGGIRDYKVTGVQTCALPIYVEAGDEQRGGVIFCEVGGLERPAEGGEWPEGAREPGVENVGVLVEVERCAARAAERGFAGHDDLQALGAVPGGDAVAPPELARDAPIADVVHPLEVGLGPVGWDEANFT